MCRSMVDIQSPTAEIRRGKKEDRQKIEPFYKRSPKNDRICLSNALDRPSNQFFPVCQCVCKQIGCRMITSTILYRFSPNIARGSVMWSLRRLLFVRQTRSSFPIIIRGVRIPISAVFRLWWPHFSTDEHQIPYTDKIQQCRLCYTMVNETGNRNRNRIIEMCNFRIWFWLVHSGTLHL